MTYCNISVIFIFFQPDRRSRERPPKPEPGSDRAPPAGQDLERFAAASSRRSPGGRGSKLPDIEEVDPSTPGLAESLSGAAEEEVHLRPGQRARQSLTKRLCDAARSVFASLASPVASPQRSDLNENIVAK